MAYTNPAQLVERQEADTMTDYADLIKRAGAGLTLVEAGMPSYQELLAALREVIAERDAALSKIGNVTSSAQKLFQSQVDAVSGLTSRILELEVQLAAELAKVSELEIALAESKKR